MDTVPEGVQYVDHCDDCPVSHSSFEWIGANKVRCIACSKDKWHPPWFVTGAPPSCQKMSAHVLDGGHLYRATKLDGTNTKTVHDAYLAIKCRGALWLAQHDSASQIFPDLIKLIELSQFPTGRSLDSSPKVTQLGSISRWSCTVWQSVIARIVQQKLGDLLMDKDAIPFFTLIVDGKHQQNSSWKYEGYMIRWVDTQVRTRPLGVRALRWNDQTKCPGEPAEPEVVAGQAEQQRDMKPAGTSACFARLRELLREYGDPDELLSRCMELFPDGSMVLQGWKTGLLSRLKKYNRECFAALDKQHFAETAMKKAEKTEKNHTDFLTDLRALSKFWHSEGHLEIRVRALGGTGSIGSTIVQRTIDPLMRAMNSIMQMYPFLNQVLRTYVVAYRLKVDECKKRIEKKRKREEEEKERADKARRAERGVAGLPSFRRGRQSTVTSSPAPATSAGTPSQGQRPAPKVPAPKVSGNSSAARSDPTPSTTSTPSQVALRGDPVTGHGLHISRPEGLAYFTDMLAMLERVSSAGWCLYANCLRDMLTALSPLSLKGGLVPPISMNMLFTSFLKCDCTLRGPSLSIGPHFPFFTATAVGRRRRAHYGIFFEQV